MDSISAATAGKDAMLVRAAETDGAKGALLLKKAIASEKNLVGALLPTPNQPGPGQKLNILA